MEERVERIKRAVAQGQYRLSLHAEVEAEAENITESEVLEAIGEGEILEEYPDDERGPSCLLCGRTARGRDLHIVLTMEHVPVILITVYEPKPPKWTSARQRGVRE